MSRPRHPATGLTVAKLKDDGWPVVEVVERFIPAMPGSPGPGHRVDLLGFVDVLAVGPLGTMAIQATSLGGVSDRLRKARTERAKYVGGMLAAGWHLHIWGWHQPNGPRTRWHLKRDVDLRVVMHTTDTGDTEQ